METRVTVWDNGKLKRKHKSAGLVFSPSFQVSHVFNFEFSQT